jgi:putative flavoprotein involved in K+ transport
MALGLSGFPHTPSFTGRDEFVGPQIHSSNFQPTPELAGKNVVVVGANNSAHDIASALVEVGAHPVMLQRSSTLVVKQSVYCNKMLGKLYSKAAIAQGIDADEGDFIFSSVPMRLMETRHRELWREIQAEDAEFYQRLTDAGFAIDFAEDGTGLGLKYRRTASGYYIDVGASEMVMDGRISVRSGVNIERLTETHVMLDTGESLPADVLVYATGYGNMIDWVATLIDQDTAERVGPCWGYGSNTKGDPGPWVGELRNMWKPTAQPGLWFMGGNLAQARYFSKMLAMQLKAALHGCNALS